MDPRAGAVAPRDPIATDDARALTASRPETSRLVVRVRAGDVDAFDALISPLLSTAYRCALRLLGDHHDAEDLVQEACLRALERIDHFDERLPFGPWFLRVLTNLGLNERQHRARRTHESLTLETPSASLPGPDVLHERQEVRERFAVALAALPERQREVVMLHEIDGWTALEIGALLGIAPATVRWHLHEARRNLRVALHAFRDGATNVGVEAG